ncbi:hypothetical protein MDAP_001562 [Mitosporidium daphniae]
MLGTTIYAFSFVWNFAAVVLFGGYPERVIPPYAIELNTPAYEICSGVIHDVVRILAPTYLGYAFLSLFALFSKSLEVKKAISSALAIVFLVNLILEVQWITTKRWKTNSILAFMFFDFLVFFSNAYIAFTY